MEKQYIFKPKEEQAMKLYAQGKMTSRELGKIMGVSHTHAVTLAGRYFIQAYANGILRLSGKK